MIHVSNFKKIYLQISQLYFNIYLHREINISEMEFSMYRTTDTLEMKIYDTILASSSTSPSSVLEGKFCCAFPNQTIVPFEARGSSNIEEPPSHCDQLDSFEDLIDFLKRYLRNKGCAKKSNLSVSFRSEYRKIIFQKFFLPISLGPPYFSNF